VESLRKREAKSAASAARPVDDFGEEDERKYQVFWLQRSRAVRIIKELGAKEFAAR